VSISGKSPVIVPHPFNEIPVRVDVQVKVLYDSQEYIFPGLSSAQRDNDVASEYGDVAYMYNESSVLLYVPKGKSTGRVIHTGTCTSHQIIFIHLQYIIVKTFTTPP
jgi:hypothetical protein